MATATASEWQIGQSLWWEDHEYKIVRVGRKWLTMESVASGHYLRVDMKTLQVDDDFRTSYMTRTLEEYTDKVAREKAWSRLAAFVRDKYLPPATVGLESIYQAAAILGIKLEGD